MINTPQDRINTQKALNVVAVKQLAEAFVHIAKVNHYMVGLVHTYDIDDLDAAEQILIDRQNAGPQKGAQYKLLDRALDVLDAERTKYRQRDVRDMRLAHVLSRLETLAEDLGRHDIIQPIIDDVRLL